MTQATLDIASQDHGVWPQLRRLWRVARVVVHLCWGVVKAAMLGAFRDPLQPRILDAKQRWCLQLLAILGVEVELRLPQQEAVPDGAVFLVSNHVSWLDIPVIASQRHLYFLSKAEVADWPIIGGLAKAVGTLFIRRGSGESGAKAKEIAARLRQGHPVLVFPEGTTTDGVSVRRFHGALFAAPVAAAVAVQPLALRYLTASGDVNTDVAFIGDDEFHHHLWALLLKSRTQVVLTLMPPLPAGNYSSGQLCDLSHAKILAALGS